MFLALVSQSINFYGYAYPDISYKYNHNEMFLFLIQMLASFQEETKTVHSAVSPKETMLMLNEFFT